MSHPAAFADDRADGRSRCGLCPHHCTPAPGEPGDCLTRVNRDGRLEVSTYGRLRAAANDPIEKKPLFHFRPGSGTYSIASDGCNLVCPFCQNHGLSQSLRDGPAGDPEGRPTEPREVVEAALRGGSRSISFTYSEPVLSFEFARDVAALAGPRDLDLVFVTNGQVSEGPARELAGFLAAANVDLKCFSKEAYRKQLGGSLRATLRAIDIYAELGVWVEVTTLVIPGFNDSEDELGEIARHLRGVSVDLPWHVSRFHPDYRWQDRAPTPVETLQRARLIGLAEGLRYVYTGNLPGDEGEKTFCPSCGGVAIDRAGYRVLESNVSGGACGTCGHRIAGRGM